MRRPIATVTIFLICLFSACAATAADNATITGDGVRMRWESSTDADIVTSLNKGTRVEVVRRSGISQTINGDSAYWYYVNYGNESGFVFGRFVAIDPVAAPSFEPVIVPGGPSFPFEDWGACPMECCAYREWSVRKETVIRSDRYETAPAAFTVRPGEWVTGITGVVIVEVPGRAEVTTSMKLGNRQAAPGDVVEFLTYQGEGFYKVWFKGQMLDGIEGYDSIVMKVEPVWVWWAEIRNKKGQVGWTNEVRNFGNIYSCGD
ncbi:MAG: SH3 domain-containing protein [Deltaproteobacteria bacterium]|nr:SH3 domain-containing protein [Candidatus Zymogenaceae bacterium]